MRRYQPTIYQIVVMTLCALMSAWVAWYGLFETKGFMSGLQIELTGPGGRAEIMAQYGAYFAVLALAAAGGALGLLRSTSILLMFALLFGGLIFGRLYALNALGWENFEAYPRMLRSAHYIDGVSFVATVLALMQGDRSRSEK